LRIVESEIKFDILIGGRIYISDHDRVFDNPEKPANQPKIKYKNEGMTIVHTGRFHTCFVLDVDLNSREVLTGTHRKKILDFVRYSYSMPHLLARTPYLLLRRYRNS